MAGCLDERCFGGAAGRAFSKFFVDATVSLFKHGEAGFFCVADRERLSDSGRVDRRDQLVDRRSAKWAALERWSGQGTEQLKSLAAAVASGLTFGCLVVVDWHQLCEE